MKKTFLLFLFCITSSAIFGQEIMTLPNTKTYPATSNWDFICENYALTGITKVQVAKTEKGGTLRLAIETTNPKFTIAGTVYVFLADNTVIICTDKGIRETKDNQIISYYNFSPIEMNKLKMTEIQSIHFNIAGKADGFSSQIGNFTAVNRKKYFSTAFDKSKKGYDTVAEITLLYN